MTDKMVGGSLGTEQDLRRLTRELIAGHRHHPDTVFWAAQFDAGLAWVHHPVGAGGLALPVTDQSAVDEELQLAGRLSTWMRNPMGIGMVAPALVAYGTPEQRDLLRAIFTGEQIWCQLFSEPGAGSDVAGLSTRARVQADGWVLNGQKVWTSLAHASAYGLLLARTDPDLPKNQGITAFILDMHRVGVTVRPLRDMTGASHFNEVFLDDVHVSDTDRLGPVGAGWAVARTMLSHERTVIGASADGPDEAPISMALQKWRSSPRTDPGQRAELTQLWIDAELLRLAGHRDQSGPSGAVLKLQRALLMQRIATFVVGLMGEDGLLFDGYEQSAPVDPAQAAQPITDPVRAWLQSPAYTIAGGTSDIMRTLIGEQLLGLPREPSATSGKPWSELAR
jgi:alkylation response protein AidB-like acyl-CoA dehydrogenase